MDVYSQPAENIFSEFSPDDFDFLAPSACWIPPCWISVPLTFRAKSERAKARFLLPMKFDFQADPFARKSVFQQFSSLFSPIQEEAYAAGRQWSDFLWSQFSALQQAFADTTQLFQAPLRFLPRAEFEKCGLDIVLNGDPEQFDIYISEDTDSSRNEVFVLRMHSSLWHYNPNQKYLWFEKRVPWRLHTEDLLPWFDATVKKLPRNRQPMDWSAWKQKLLDANPEFAPQRLSPDARWEDKPPVVLVFGTRDEVGYAALFHLERGRIQSIKRAGKELFIKTTIANRYEKDSEKLWWTFRICSPSAPNAERLERRLLSGEQIHFGLGDDISGMVATNDNAVHFINVDPALIKRCYSRAEMMLLSFTPQRFRHKTYFYYKKEPISLEETHRL